MRLSVRRAPEKKLYLHVVPIEPSERTADLSIKGLAVALFAAAVFGVLVRALWVSASDFPLNDGGMFYAMASDLQHAGYRLPGETTYNTANIPYAYPPLGFYAAALLDDLTPMGLTMVFRVLPLMVSILTIPAFYYFARDFTRSRTELAAAVFAFALIPRSFIWLIMGGGLTRGFGLLFAILALQQLHTRFNTGRTTHAVLAGALGGLVVISHLEMAWFLTFSGALLLLSRGRNWAGVTGTALAAATASIVAAPWLITTTLRHGIAPFTAATSSSSPSEANPVLALLVFDPTNEPMFAMMAALGLLGAIVCLGRREFLLPAWVIAAGLLDPRAFGTVASVPLALLAGIAVARVLLPLLSTEQGQAQAPRVAARMAAMPVMVSCAIIAYALISAVGAGPRLLVGLTPDDREAMAWIAANTPPDARVLVITGDRWAVDRTSEWFPVLGQRKSVATVQGSEWLAGGGFATRLEAYNAAQACAEADAACVDDWSRAFETPYDYIFLPKVAPQTKDDPREDEICCHALVASLRDDSDYQLVYDGPRATIFARH
jgi:hypothetical protein